MFSHLLTKDDKFSLRKPFSILVGLIGVLFIVGFDTIINIYYPASENKTVNGKNFHEYYVVSESIKYVCNKLWKYNIKRIIGINLRDSNHLVKLK